MDLTGQTLVGKYEIEGLLGQGGMGAVWRARHTLTGRKLAIKVLDETYKDNSPVAQRFGREARAASRIQHPGIVEVLDLDSTDQGIPFIVMEFLEGETLASRIERRGRLGQDELVRLGQLLLEALDAAHTHGVIHRDLKPENIYVVSAGRGGDAIKILDFGISQIREPGDEKLTVTGSVLGTPHYMSPEQAMGETHIDHRADLYAAGVVLYECAVGDVPYDAPNYNRLLRLILDEDPLPPRSRGAEISAEVEQVILWAMEKHRDDRVPSAREMLEWLGRAAAGDPVPRPQRSALDDLGLEFDSEDPLDLPFDEPPAPVRLGGPVRRHPVSTPAPGSVQLKNGQWEVSPALRSLGEKPISSTPPPSDRIEVELGIATPAPPPMSELELDEGAMRPKRSSGPPGGSYVPGRSNPSMRAVTGTTTSIPAGPAARRSLPAAAGRRPEPPPPEPREAPGWGRNLLWALAALALFAGLVFVVRMAVQPGHVDPNELQPPVAPDHDPEPPRPTGPRWVSIRVVGLPPSAHVRLDGLPASSPLRVRHGTHHVLEISADGYEDRRIEFSGDRNRTIHARMVPAVGTVQTAP